MDDTTYLRDERHVDKRLFIFDGKTFYESFGDAYRPSNQYLDCVNEILRRVAGPWRILRDQVWFHVTNPSIKLPHQGWKIHLSAVPDNSLKILSTVADLVLQRNIPFKFALDPYVRSLMCSKGWSRGGSGKFITIYPTSLEQFKELIEAIYLEVSNEPGPYILSDQRYKDCRVLYYRYGGILSHSEIDFTGQKVPLLVSPDGLSIPDERTPFFMTPPWESDPFPPESSDDEAGMLIGGKYAIKSALSFSNSGGVYLAEDQNGDKVAIKEARPFTVIDEYGHDAVQRLEKERQILALLEPTRRVPKTFGIFSEWEHKFLVEEFVEGVDLRELLLSESPLVRVNPTDEDGTRFYQMFCDVFREILSAIADVHRHGVVFGDISPNNIKIDPVTHKIRLIDLESASRLNSDDPSVLHTLGFRKREKPISEPATQADDLHAVASSMAYFLFPISAFSVLKEDFFTNVVPVIIRDIGWDQTPVQQIIDGLSAGTTSCEQASELLSSPAVLKTPGCSSEIDDDFVATAAQKFGDFLLAHMRPDSDLLFPADPFAHLTNPLSLGFGASGVLYALKKAKREIPNNALNWLESRLDKLDLNTMPPGLLTGTSGVAWCLAELGMLDRAQHLMLAANRSRLASSHHSYLYGMAGIGIANLHFYHLTNDQRFWQAAVELANQLLEHASENERGLSWPTGELTHLGLGYGQSGVALFFLRLFEMSGDHRWLSAGNKALGFDLSHSIEIESGVTTFQRGIGDSTADHYLEEGSAGIARVALRFGFAEQSAHLLTDAHRKYSVFAGLFFGLGSFVDIFSDAQIFLDKQKYRQMANRPLAGIRDIYLLKYAEGWATPGDGLFRVSCDFATGVAGLLRAFSRSLYLDHADFTLDEVGCPALSVKGASCLSA